MKIHQQKEYIPYLYKADFADTFLPKVGGYKGKAMWIFDGAELFPVNRLGNWAETTINGESAFWIRISSPTSTSTAPTIKSIKKRGLQAYCTTADVFQLLQLGNVIGGDNFTSRGHIVPAKDLIDFQIQQLKFHSTNNKGDKYENNE